MICVKTSLTSGEICIDTDYEMIGTKCVARKLRIVGAYRPTDNDYSALTMLKDFVRKFSSIGMGVAVYLMFSGREMSISEA